MTPFFLATGGRTGSTAVLDSLGKLDSIATLQEPFLTGRGPTESIVEYGDPVPFFEHHLRTLPVFQRLGAKLSEQRVIEDYIDRLVASATGPATQAFGFKALRNQLKAHKALAPILRARDYRCIYLKRSTVHQAISRLVAGARGVYNSRTEQEFSEPVTIDTDAFRRSITHGDAQVERDIAALTAQGFPLISVDYETFTDDPARFFGEIQDFLDVPRELPPPSDFKRMIKSLDDTVANLDALRAIARELGHRLD